jgi:hypothetical protein
MVESFGNELPERFAQRTAHEHAGDKEEQRHGAHRQRSAVRHEGIRVGE